jgi:YVTN family beta-propeller protein
MKTMPPGPRGSLLLGNLPDFATDVLGYHERCRDEFGDIVRLRLAGRTFFLISHPDLVHTVLVANHGDGSVSVVDLVTKKETSRFQAGTGIETLTYY